MIISAVVCLTSKSRILARFPSIAASRAISWHRVDLPTPPFCDTTPTTFGSAILRLKLGLKGQRNQHKPMGHTLSVDSFWLAETRMVWCAAADVDAAAAAATRGKETDDVVHTALMFAVTEAEAAAIRTAFEQGGEFAAAVELRRLFPGVTDNAEARECARTIAAWRPLQLPLARRSMQQQRGS
jgi:hypothetical protein